MKCAHPGCPNDSIGLSNYCQKHRPFSSTTSDKMYDDDIDKKDTSLES